MNDELKPVRCGCGGNAAVLLGELTTYFEVKCCRCGTKTALKRTRNEAIEAWNRAMGERTVKVENQYRDYLPYTHFMEDDLRGNCENCGETVWKGEKYCHECGARLNWGDDEEDIPIEYFENGGI